MTQRSSLAGKLASPAEIEHPRRMGSVGSEKSVIPSAPFDDLDLDTAEGRAEWESRVMAMATDRIIAERARLEAMGIIDKNGDLVSKRLPPDMLPESDTTVETG